MPERQPRVRVRRVYAGEEEQQGQEERDHGQESEGYGEYARYRESARGPLRDSRQG